MINEAANRMIRAKAVECAARIFAGEKYVTGQLHGVTPRDVINFADQIAHYIDTGELDQGV